MNRRDLLTATPAALMGIAAPVLPAAADPAPGGLSALHRRFLDWEALFRAAAMPERDEAESEALLDCATSIEREILAMPSETSADFALKMCVVTAYGGFLLPPESTMPVFAAEAKTLSHGQALPDDPNRAHVAPDADLLATYVRWVSLQREWLRLIDLPRPERHGFDLFDLPEVVAVEKEARALFAHMLTMKPQTPQGFAVYIALIWEEFAPPTLRGTADFEEEAAGPEYAPILAAWRHVGSGEPYPDQWRVNAADGLRRKTDA